MSIKKLYKPKQNRLLSKTWRTVVLAREIEKNNFHVTGDVHKAHEFAYMAANFELPPVRQEPRMEPIVIYSIL